MHGYGSWIYRLSDLLCPLVESPEAYCPLYIIQDSVSPISHLQDKAASQRTKEITPLLSIPLITNAGVFKVLGTAKIAVLNAYISSISMSQQKY